MKVKINWNLSQKLDLNHRDHFFILNKNINNSNVNEEQKLFNQKSSLEAALYLIKNFQLEYLSKQIKKDKNKTIKKMLISLRDNIRLMLEEKIKKLNYIKGQNEISKNKIQNILFPPSNSENLDKYKINTKISEKNQLKLLNFQIENEIEKTKFLTEQKAQIIGYITSIPFFFEANKEIFCNNNYETITKITELLNEMIRRVRKEFIDVVKAKMKQELEINGITVQINYIKDNIEDYKLKGCKKYIESEDIIQEDSKEYVKSIFTNQSKRNSLSSINNIRYVKKKSGINSKNKDIIIKKERIIKNKTLNNNIFFTNKINKSILNDINNKNVNNYLNMNINVNINLNNNNFRKESFNSSSESNNEDNEKNEQYEMDLNENNKIIISPITTYENANTINNNIKTESSKNGDSFVLDIKDN